MTSDLEIEVLAPFAGVISAFHSSPSRRRPNHTMRPSILVDSPNAPPWYRDQTVAPYPHPLDRKIHQDNTCSPHQQCPLRSDRIGCSNTEQSFSLSLWFSFSWRNSRDVFRGGP